MLSLEITNNHSFSYSFLLWVALLPSHLHSLSFHSQKLFIELHNKSSTRTCSNFQNWNQILFFLESDSQLRTARHWFVGLWDMWSFCWFHFGLSLFHLWCQFSFHLLVPLWIVLLPLMMSLNCHLLVPLWIVLLPLMMSINCHLLVPLLVVLVPLTMKINGEKHQ